MFGESVRESPRCRGAATAAVVAGAMILVGCSSPSSPGFSAPSLSSIFGSSPKPAATEAQAAVPPVEIDCPSVAVRQGASTLAMSANPAEPSAINLRYQVGIAETARECRLASGTVTMRVGVQGRVILGPAGGPGRIDLPLRLAVVHEGPEPKTIVTKLQRVSVAIPSDQTNVQFTHVEDDLTFPMPARAADIDNYIVYVGFDPIGMQELDKKKKPERRAPAKPRRTT
jgi:hypothetical protein